MAGFDLVVESGIGGSLLDFDSILLHTFPDASKASSQLWQGLARHQTLAAQPRLVEAFQDFGECGILAETLARKAISTSFVGACGGAWMMAELLRGLHGGSRSNSAIIQ